MARPSRTGSSHARTSGRLAAGLTAGVLVAGLACRSAPPSASPAGPAGAPSASSPSEAARSPARELAAEPPPGAQITASGVAIHVIDPGDPEAPQPHPGDVLELRYRVWDETGRLVGASRAGRTEQLALTWLPAGWGEAMGGLHVGAHAHVWVPAERAYATHPDGPQGGLAIDVHLVGLTSPELAEGDVPPLATPPANALRSASGLHFVVLRAGTGLRHAAPDSRVTVHYEGWTADGNRFDSSYERGPPTTFPLTAVISGWQEAVPLMVEGEKTRFWIPEELAYGQVEGRPKGMLIFDIELVRIEN